MNIDRFQQLLNAYGTSVERWPLEEREAASLLLTTSEDAKARRDRAARLDNALDAWHVEIPDRFRDSVITTAEAATGRDALESILDWLIPDADKIFPRIWRPLLAASVPLVLGVVLGGSLFLDNETSDQTWKEEIYLMALASDDIGVAP